MSQVETVPGGSLSGGPLGPLIRPHDPVLVERDGDFDLTVHAAASTADEAGPTHRVSGTLENLFRTAFSLLNPKQRDTALGQAVEILKSTSVLFAAEMALMVGLDAVLPEEIGAGNAEGDGIEQGLMTNPMAEFALIALVLPVIEEIGCRYLPSKLADKGAAIISACAAKVLPEELARKVSGFVGDHNSKRWLLGSVVALGFAAMHNLTDNPDAVGIPLGDGLTFSLRDLALPQIMFGLYSWNLMRRFGLKASLGAHVFSNTLAAGIILGFGGEGA